MCQCRFLSEAQFPQIAKTFDEAFADYHLKSRVSAKEWLYNRGVKNAVEYDYSVGAFDGERMVGFTLVGIDNWLGQLAAFDAGTGIIPDYRGRGLAKGMFDFAVPKLRERGVGQFLLEVLQVNEAAIKAYRKAGFQITREFDCLALEYRNFKVAKSLAIDPQIRPIPKKEVASFSEFADWQPSWENSFASIARIPDEVVINGAYVDGEPVGLFVYYPLLNWIMSLVVKRAFRRKGIATVLLAKFMESFDSDVSKISLVNVDHSDTGMLGFLEKMGFVEFTRQYEMELDL
ncbi:MAG: GNAT family N-acetyltransferase [Candidatus Zixiibacteriota bacterium]|nr:MAG: GNAT family N-acetyltransferase [candidate division Zixibacteria bacterium]